MEKNRQLTEEADSFEERLHERTKWVEKRRLSAVNRVELEVSAVSPPLIFGALTAKGIGHDPFVSKLITGCYLFLISRHV